ncbi:MAG: DUF393 domain-containing protein [Rhodobacteraceae bacterium]|nr:DUF393 domain-containing protein [Paracoccaceae bacterium]
MISVYYDGKCSLCSKEINYFKQRTPKHPILWHDIATHPEHLEDTGLSQSEALMFMRVRDATGTLHSEVDAFIVMWSQFSGWALLARALSVPGIYQLVGLVYRRFAAYRFAKYPHCKASLSG